MGDYRFEGLTVVLTGAAAGLGKAYADLLASLGATLFLNDLDPEIETVAEAIRDRGGRAEAHIGSVADPHAATRLVAAAMDATGRVDAVINNAGVGLHRGFADCTLADFQRLMDVHFFGTLHLTQAAWPVMVAARRGRIVNVVSSTLYGYQGWSAYAAAKGAIFGFSRTLALEAEAHGIAVNMIAPGAATPMVFAHAPDAETIRWMSKTAPPEAVASTAAFLAHPACTTNGRIFQSAGGHVSEMLLGSTIGVPLADASVAAMAETVDRPGMKRGFAAESSVQGNLARRAAPDYGFDRVSAAREALEALARLDIDTLTARFAADIVFSLPYAPEPIAARLEGRDAAIAMLREGLGSYDSFALTIDALHDCPETHTVLVESRSEAVTKDGRAYANRYVQVIGFAGSEITLWREYFDPSRLQAP